MSQRLGSIRAARDGGEPAVAAADVSAALGGDPVDRQAVRARLFRGAAPRDGRGWVDERAGWRRTVSRAVPITAAVVVSAAIIGLSPVAIPVVWVVGHWLSPPGSGLGPVVAMGGVVLVGITQAAVGMTAAGAGLYVGQLRRSLALIDDDEEQARLHRPSTLALLDVGAE